MREIKEQERLGNGELIVQVPGGARMPMSYVRQVPEGVHLHMEPNGRVHGIHKDGRRIDFDEPSSFARAWMEDPDHPERRYWWHQRVSTMGATGSTGSTGTTGSTGGPPGGTPGGTGNTGATG